MTLPTWLLPSWLPARAARIALVAVPVVALVAVLFGARSCLAPPAAPPAKVVVTRDAAAEFRRVEQAAAHVEEKRATVRHVERRVERRPDGAVVSTVTEDERTDAAATTSATVGATTDGKTTERETVTVERPPPRFRLAAAAAWDLAAPRPRPSLYAGTASVRVAGPVWLGVRVQSDRPKRPEVAVSVEW